MQKCQKYRESTICGEIDTQEVVEEKEESDEKRMRKENEKENRRLSGR